MAWFGVVYCSVRLMGSVVARLTQYTPWLVLKLDQKVIQQDRAKKHTVLVPVSDPTGTYHRMSVEWFYVWL